MQSPETHAAARPFARRCIALAVPQDVDDAVDDRDRILPLFGRQAGRRGRRANLDALAATGAGVEHLVDAGLQGGLECLGHWKQVHPHDADARQ